MKTMDHATAMRKAIAESYVLDELSEEERAEFEAHFFTCPECAEDVKELAIFIDDTRRTLGRPPAARRPGATMQRLRRLMLPLAATAVLSLGATVYQTAVTVPQLRQDLAQAQSLQATSVHFLSVARSDPAEIRVSAQQRMIGLTLSRTGYGSPDRYRIDLRDAEGALVLSSVVAAPAAGDELQLFLPVADLRPGRYAVELSGIDSAEEQTTPAAVTRYPFVLTREET
jgi:Putative zinc-finger